MLSLKDWNGIPAAVETPEASSAHLRINQDTALFILTVIAVGYANAEPYQGPKGF
jgi:hypothetical protein